MNFCVKYSAIAKADINDIINNIGVELSNPEAAKRFFNNVKKKENIISENPFIYPLHRNEKLHEKGYRFVAVGNYLVLYLVDEDKKIATITRIIYGRRDITSILNLD
ncbi:MAG: type II toxin-antitoxin system RelE/ParE family toxin [Oscillospiraceae bacterium]|nr:type II toxin-antitoxin system RelE/ParE family toxin [Oscillospiraceae bacterium]